MMKLCKNDMSCYPLETDKDSVKKKNRDISCQPTPFSVFFCGPSPILLKFGMFVDFY